MQIAICRMEKLMNCPLKSSVYNNLFMPYLPTIISSHSEAVRRMFLQRSMVKMVLELLNMEVREDMRAANITAIIKPLRP